MSHGTIGLPAVIASLLIAFGAKTGVAEPDHIKLDDGTRTRCVTVLRAGLRSSEFWPSIHAAEGLTLGGHGDEVKRFLNAKRLDDHDDQQKCGIARELVRAGDRTKANIMLDILAGEDDFGHVHAAESLYKVFEIGDGVAMQRAFRQDGNVKLKLMAAGALARHGNADAMKSLRETIGHSEPEAFQIAVWILGRIGDKSDISRIRKNIDRSPNKLIRAYHDHALAALGDPEGLKALAANLNSDDPAIRTYAATFAGDARALNVADTLKRMLDDPHEDARIRAAQSLLVLSRRPQPVDHGR